MSEMIERVARVLEPQAWAALSVGDTLAYANRRKSSLRKAILVIKEMREPTDAMIKAASANLYGRCFTSHTHHLGVC